MLPPLEDLGDFVDVVKNDVSVQTDLGSQVKEYAISYLQFDVRFVFLGCPG